MERLLQAIGDPHVSLPPTIHVCGTNGKGSTIAFLKAIFEAAGYSVHTYTSPHLLRFEERIVLRGNPIRPGDLHMLLEEVRIANADQPVDFFEATTATAMLAFARVPADILLMESGLGGEYDPTNTAFHPRLTILTQLSLDHARAFGNTLAEVALNEAGALRPDTPCLLGIQSEEAREIVRVVAKRKGTPIYIGGEQWHVREEEEAMAYEDVTGIAYLPKPTLRGAHQIRNAGNAIAAVTMLHEFNIGSEHIEAGLLHARWPGRLERIPANLPHGMELWFDGGHNIGGAEAIAAYIGQYWRDMPTHLIFGTTQGKDVIPMLAALNPYVDSIHVVPVLAEPLSYSSHQLLEIAGNAGISGVSEHDSMADALEEICQNSTKAARILVFGSLFFGVEFTG
jgi:dihydrofolate synthase/folylpolyglutamate synthase